MISTFQYLSPIVEAYQQINEALSKDAQKLLDTKYKSIYKEDGYDQFGVDRNGKDRKGKTVVWRIPDTVANLSPESLEKMLSYYAKKERKHNNEINHYYDRYGLDRLGFDRQGFDLNDKDVLGHSGSEYGTDEYQNMSPARDKARHNLRAKLAMRDYNYEKKRTPLTQAQERYILNSYKKAIQSDNPRKEFEKALKIIFVKFSPDGKTASFDWTSINHFLNKFKFSDKKPFTMNNTDFINQFVAMYHEQLNKILRPESADTYFSFDVEKDDVHSNDSEESYCLSVNIKPQYLNSAGFNKDNLIKAAVIASRRIDKILPYTGFQHYEQINTNSVVIHFSVYSEYHKSTEDRTSYNDMESDFLEKHKLGVFDPKLSSKLGENRQKH